MADLQNLDQEDYNKRLDGEHESIRFDTMQSMHARIDDKPLTTYLNEMDASINFSIDLKNNEENFKGLLTNPVIKEESNIESSKVFQDISLKDNHSSTNCKYDKFEIIDCMNKIPKSDKNNNNINNKLQSYIEIQDGEQKTEMGLNFRFYRLVEVFPNDTIVKCDRRYSHFFALSEKLQKKYPWIIIPQLVEKNIGSKIMTVSEKFYSKRRNHLNLFLQYLSQHDEIKRTKEYYKFITDPNFDDNYFAQEAGFYNEAEFPESIKSHDSLKNKFFDYFKNTFISPDNIESQFKDNNFFKFKAHHEFYNNAKLNLIKIKKYISRYYYNVDSLGINYAQLADNLTYLKDVKFSERNIKPELLSQTKISKELATINQKYSKELGKILKDDIDAFIYLLMGLCNALSRYFTYIDFYNDILRKNKNNKLSGNFDAVELNKEEIILKDKRTHFEAKLNAEMESFTRKYDKKFYDIIKKFQELLKELTFEELSILNRIVS